jgi:hypothetical protein
MSWEILSLSLPEAKDPRVILLREIGIRRDFTKRAERICEAVIEARFVRAPKARLEEQFEK